MFDRITPSRRGLTAWLIAGTLTGCEPEEQPTAPENPVDPVLAQTTTADVPGEFKSSPYITWVRSDIGFDRENGAWATGNMEYWANRATIDVHLDVREGNRELRRKSGHGEHWWFLPKRTTLGASVNVPLFKTCGHAGSVSALGKAWHEFFIKLSLFQWGHAARSDSDGAIQPRCTASCDTRFILTPEEEDACQNGGAGSGSGTGADDGPPDNDPVESGEASGLTCSQELVFFYDQEVFLFAHEAKICV